MVGGERRCVARGCVNYSSFERTDKRHCLVKTSSTKHDARTSALVSQADRRRAEADGRRLGRISEELRGEISAFYIPLSFGDFRTHLRLFLA